MSKEKRGWFVISSRVRWRVERQGIGLCLFVSVLVLLGIALFAGLAVFGGCHTAGMSAFLAVGLGLLTTGFLGIALFADLAVLGGCHAAGMGAFLAFSLGLFATGFVALLPERYTTERNCGAEGDDENFDGFHGFYFCCCHTNTLTRNRPRGWQP